MQLVNFNLDQALLEQYKAEYAETNCILLKDMLNPKILNKLMDKLDKVIFQTKFETSEENKFGKVLFVDQHEPVVATFNFIFNDTGLFSCLEDITNCGTIDNFTGRIHRSEEGENHRIDWHGDNADHRLLAITICLGNTPYTGAAFELRERSSKKITRSFGQLNAGDALIFRIDPQLEHRLAPLETGRRTVGVGWFRAPGTKIDG